MSYSIIHSPLWLLSHKPETYTQLNNINPPQKKKDEKEEDEKILQQANKKKRQFWTW